MIEDYDRRAQQLVALRVQVSQPAILYFGSTTAPIRLLDLSLTGALALAYSPPVEGTMISIACATEHVPARVVWTKGNRFGMAFAKPLAPVQAETMAGIRSSKPNTKSKPKPKPKTKKQPEAVKLSRSTASLGAGVIKREPQTLRAG